MRRHLLAALLVGGASLSAPVAAASPAGAGPAAAPPAAAAASCGHGLQFVAERGPGRPPLCTHGPDAKRPGVQVFGDTAAGPTMSEGPVGLEGGVQCADANAKAAVQFVYGYPAGSSARFDVQRKVIEQQVAVFDGWLDVHAGHRVNAVCANGRLDIRAVQLPAIGSDELFTYNDLVTGLKAAGMADAKRAYVAFTDHLGNSYPYCGQGNKDHDDQPDPNLNASNVGPRYSLVNCLGATWLHELVHNLGGVQSSAPHHTGASHCYDEQDIECGADGGSYFTNGGQLTYPCRGRHFDHTFDCGNDDYFHRLPAPPGNYLATHWNLASSWFLRDMHAGNPTGAGVDSRPPLAWFSQPSAPGQVNGSGFLQAAALDDSSIASIAFYRLDGTTETPLGTKTDAPFAIPLSDVQTGSAGTTVRALVTDTAGKTTTVTLSGMVNDPLAQPAAPALAAPSYAKRTKSVSLSWTHAATDLTAFELQRAKSTDFASPQWLDRPGTARSTQDASIPGRGTYYYRIRAVLPSGSRTPWSATRSITAS